MLPLELDNETGILAYIGHRIQSCLPKELFDQLLDIQVDSLPPGPDDVLPIFNGESGDLINAMPTPYALRLPRSKLQKLLTTGIEIHYSKRIREIESNRNSATATFEDGSKETANLIIGADGARSMVRQVLLGPQKAALQMSPLLASTCLAKLPVESARLLAEKHPRLNLTIHPARTILWICVHAKYNDTKPGDGVYTFIMSWVSDRDPKELQGAAILSDMKERATQFAHPFKQIVLSIPDDTVCSHNRLSYWPTEPWDNRNGTVTLAGDAAHPMTFHRGQGLNNAIDDAAQLVQQLQGLTDRTSHQEITAAINRYDEEVQQRGREAVESSLENSLMLHDWDRIMQAAILTRGMQKDAVH
ncbi:hypothetical protein EPUS_03075 [Endocarpon pusillum Z07020]|uniref:FAD-binding domain-containing protein n=1 Tax=Endocarpon pusillum (strain Z07020 / HMAS-L-300199) TaxID=1263415 RepID=U1HV69_ENDPU|nr:uncharacterized protein EPUS_03075 [Endocarpon pusillum Z07020]ERF73234.1 hypothetical protein EPUS_03075 [Endocarpon pusillum Z07020]